jgi:hypothetical protein
MSAHSVLASLTISTVKSTRWHAIWNRQTHGADCVIALVSGLIGYLLKK